MPVEAQILEHVHDLLPVAVPDWQVHTDTLIAYPRLPGEPADNSWIPPDDLFARCIALLHQLPTEPFERMGVRSYSPARQRQWIAKRLDFVRPVLVEQARAGLLSPVR